MKTSLALFALLLGTTAIPNISNAQDVPTPFPVCIHDVFGYVWNFTVEKNGNKTVYLGKGTVDIGGGILWEAHGSYNVNTHETELEATNPDADGCASGYVDAFEYEGTADAKAPNGIVTYSGSGTWTSYCSGSAFNSGDWSATDCDHKGGITNPNGPAKSGAATLKVYPNPIIGSAHISYAVATSGRVNITVYNSMQQVVKVLVNDFKNAGNYSTVLDTKSGNIQAGIYTVVVVVNGKTYSATVQVVK